MSAAKVTAIAHYVPGEENDGQNPSSSRVEDFSSHLAAGAAKRLLVSNGIPVEDIDYLMLVTQTPDFPLPSTACLVQEMLGLPQHIGAMDVRLGDSGYVHALGLAKGLLASGQANTLLLLTSDVLTKLVDQQRPDTGRRPCDAATATLLAAAEDEVVGIGPVVYGTDGGAAGAVVAAGAIRDGRDLNSRVTERGLFVDEAAVLESTLTVLPGLVDKVLSRAHWRQEDVDLVVVHPTGDPVVNELQKELRLGKERFWMDTYSAGTSGTSTIPLALSRASRAGVLQPGGKVLLAGLGAGLSWAGCTVTW